ncbi:hypothetical protein R6Q59_005667 [Mikania micrantha]
MSSPNSPCAACKFLRRKCTQECVFAPYFPPDQPQKFANVHKVFGASNVAKILNELNTNQREDAVNSLAYEADARLRDPVYGCVGLISVLQHKLKQVQKDLHDAKIELANYYIGPSVTLPVVNQGFTPHVPNMPLSVPGMPCNMQPMVHMAGQMLVAQQLEEEEMLRTSYDQPQQQPPPSRQQQPAHDLVSHMTGGGFNPVTAPTAFSASLSLGSTYVNKMHQIQQQPEPRQEQKPYLQAHQLYFQQETQQPSCKERTASEDDRSIAPSS